MTPLHYAVYGGHLKVVELLCKKLSVRGKPGVDFAYEQRSKLADMFARLAFKKDGGGVGEGHEHGHGHGHHARVVGVDKFGRRQVGWNGIQHIQKGHFWPHVLHVG